MKAVITEDGEKRLGVPAGLVIEFDEIDQFGNIVQADVVYDIRFADYAFRTLYNISVVDDDAAAVRIE